MNRTKGEKQKVVLFIKTNYTPSQLIKRWSLIYPDMDISYIDNECYLLKHKSVNLTHNMVMIRLDTLLRNQNLHPRNFAIYYPEDLLDSKNTLRYKLKRVNHAIRKLKLGDVKN